jgi:hypothetical protein
VVDVHPKEIAADARMMRCSKCRKDIWVSPAAIDKIAEDPFGTSLLCERCIPPGSVIEGFV